MATFHGLLTPLYRKRPPKPKANLHPLPALRSRGADTAEGPWRPRAGCPALPCTSRSRQGNSHGLGDGVPVPRAEATAAAPPAGTPGQNHSDSVRSRPTKAYSSRCGNMLTPLFSTAITGQAVSSWAGIFPRRSPCTLAGPVYCPFASTEHTLGRSGNFLFADPSGHNLPSEETPELPAAVAAVVIPNRPPSCPPLCIRSTSLLGLLFYPASAISRSASLPPCLPASRPVDFT